MGFVKNRKQASVIILILMGGLISFNLLSFPEFTDLKSATDYGASIEKGRYLSKAGNCATCHTEEGGKPYAGGLEFVTPFGVLYSTNITMDKDVGIGNWSFEDFYASMKHGLRPDGSHFYPAFPYTDFAKMTDDDIASLYLYFQTLEPVNQPAKENQLNFPFNNRELLAGWKVLFHSPETFNPDSARSEEWNRGAYLVEGPGHCGACHTPRNIFGAEQESLALTGGTYMDKVKFGYHRQWSGVNLTSHTSGLASWSKEDLVEYLKEGVSGNAVVHGPMKEVVMNSTRYLNDADLDAMATYLKSLPASAQPSLPKPDPNVVTAGEFVYTVHCGSCHLPSGKGDEGLGVTLSGSPTVQAPDPSSLINVILYGPHLPASLSVDRSRMKMFGKRLSDEDIANVATYVRNSFGNSASEVTPEQVHVQR